jgi:hypothetical protein
VGGYEVVPFVSVTCYWYCGERRVSFFRLRCCGGTQCLDNRVPCKLNILGTAAEVSMERDSAPWTITWRMQFYNE